MNVGELRNLVLGGLIGFFGAALFGVVVVGSRVERLEERAAAALERIGKLEAGVTTPISAEARDAINQLRAADAEIKAALHGIAVRLDSLSGIVRRRERESESKVPIGPIGKGG